MPQTGLALLFSTALNRISAGSFSQLLLSITVALLLMLLEYIVQQDFVCPCKYWKLKVALWFVGPFVTLSVFSLLLKSKGMMLCGMFKVNCGDMSCCTAWCCLSFQSCCRSSFQILYPGLCWCLILFLDGRYINCGFQDPCANGTLTRNKTLPPTPEGELTQVIMFYIIFALPLLYILCCFPLCTCCYSATSNRSAWYNCCSAEAVNEELERVEVESTLEEYVVKLRQDRVQQKIAQLKKELFEDTSASQHCNTCGRAGSDNRSGQVQEQGQVPSGSLQDYTQVCHHEFFKTPAKLKTLKWVNILQEAEKLLPGGGRVRIAQIELDERPL
ncbi:uncharacterized protein LOC136769503 [Amia ocellicauda]|uniref:uncharacterized protein LOC136769503 n=1 Tax=Amia ocellicauda TaxID=2972642 RepID=UPI00346419E1